MNQLGLDSRTQPPVIPSADLREFIERAQRGDTDAFESLMRHYAPLVNAYFYSRTYDEGEAEDLFQETFFAVYRELHRLRNRDQIGPWIMRIARSKWVDSIRRKQTHRERLAEFAAEQKSACEHPGIVVRPGPMLTTANRELGALLASAIGRTGEKYRVILTLNLIEECTPAEIGELLGLKGSTVRMRLQRGLKQLHNLLRKSGLDLDTWTGDH